MIELGKLEARHEDFAKRTAQVAAVSLDDEKLTTETQKLFPHLIILSDADKSLANAVGLIAPQKSPSGGETVAPTTAIIGRDGVVRWVSRKGNFLERTTPEEILAALDQQKGGQ